MRRTAASTDNSARSGNGSSPPAPTVTIVCSHADEPACVPRIGGPAPPLFWHAGQRSWVQSAVSQEGLEARAMLGGGLLGRVAASRVGQGGADQVDGPAQVRVRRHGEAIGPGQAAVEVILG